MSLSSISVSARCKTTIVVKTTVVVKMIIAVMTIHYRLSADCRSSSDPAVTTSLSCQTLTCYVPTLACFSIFLCANLDRRAEVLCANLGSRSRFPTVCADLQVRKLSAVFNFSPPADSPNNEWSRTAGAFFLDTVVSPLGGSYCPPPVLSPHSCPRLRGLFDDETTRMMAKTNPIPILLPFIDLNTPRFQATISASDYIQATKHEEERDREKCGLYFTGDAMTKKPSKKKSTSGVKHDPNAMLKALKKEVKALKLEAKTLHTEIKEEEASFETEKAASAAGDMISRREQLQGNELLKLSHLTNMLGFDEGTITEHLQDEIKKLEKLQSDKQQDRKNMDTNIKKMKEMNEQSERAIGAATEQYDKTVAESSRLKEQLDEAELKLYSIETKVKHSRGMKTVEITNKESLRNVVKEVANEVKRRCDDKEVVVQVLKVAAKCLAAEMEASFSAFRSGSDDSDSSGSVDISSASSDDDD